MTQDQSKSTLAIKAATRKQLQGLGASNYHAVKITESIKPIGRQGRASLYAISEIIASIYSYKKRPRLKPETHIKLEQLLDILLNMLGNVVPASFKSATNSTNSRLSQQLIKAMAKTDATLASLKLDVAGINSEYEFSGNQW